MLHIFRSDLGRSHTTTLCRASSLFPDLFSPATQSTSTAYDRGEGQEMLGLHFDPVHNTLSNLLLLRRNPPQLGMVDTPDGVVGADGSLR